MGHEKHMVFFIGFFYQNNHFDQVLSHTSNQEGQTFKMVQDAHGLINHTKWPCLVKLTILIWLVNLLAMLTRLPTYLPNIYLPTYLNMSYVPIAYHIPTHVLFIYLHTYLLSIYPCLTYLFAYHIPTHVLFIYLITYLPYTYPCPMYLLAYHIPTHVLFK